MPGASHGRKGTVKKKAGSDVQRSRVPDDSRHIEIGSRQSLSDLCSDEEVIVFTGKAKKNPPKQGSKFDTASLISKAEKNLDSVAQTMPSTAVNSVGVTLAAGEDIRLETGIKEPRKRSSQHWVRRNRALMEDEENAIIAEYIANIESTDGMNDTMMVQQFQHRDLDLDGWTESVKGLDHNDVVNSEIRDQDEWNSADLQDFDCFSSSSELMSATPCILRRRLRKSEAQYLVVASDESVDKARWVTRDLLTASATSDLIDVFEKNLSKVGESAAYTSSIEESSTLDTAEDEHNFRAKRNAHASDERLGRLSSMQAGLRLSEDDLALIDGHEFDEISSDNNVSAIGNALVPPKPSFSSKKQGNQSSIHGLSTRSRKDRALGPYDGFDVMDHERPSLWRKTKGRFPSQQVLDLSDSDLQQSMIATWQSDRAKKKQRKQDRELLRAQGGLGKKGKREIESNLHRDIAMDDIPGEIRSFLESSTPSLSLPPMGQRERKLIHVIAHKSGLKSKSAGAGAARFPVLYRTSRTKKLTPSLEAQINRLFTPRSLLPSFNKTHWKGNTVIRNGSGGMNAAASYRDGEIVGVGAPEVGAENRGRAMLEKMGWTTGNSLGALNNKGISQPIEQIVKTSKAGLG